jgi:hypothetical protein
VGHRASLYYVKKRKFLTPPGLELRPLGSPARSQSLYRLRYPVSFVSSICLLHLNIFRRNIYAGIYVGWSAELPHRDDW